MGGVTVIVLDTCALLWWTLDPDALSPAAARSCRTIATHGACASAISLWEMGIKWRSGAICLGDMDLRTSVRTLQMVDGLELIPVPPAVWVENVVLDSTSSCCRSGNDRGVRLSGSGGSSGSSIHHGIPVRSPCRSRTAHDRFSRS